MSFILATTGFGQQGPSLWVQMCDFIVPPLLKWIIVPMLAGPLLLGVFMLAAMLGMLAGSLLCGMVGIRLAEDGTFKQSAAPFVTLCALAGIGCYVWLAGPFTWGIVVAWWNA